MREATPRGDRPLEDVNQGPRKSGHQTGISGLKTYPTVCCWNQVVHCDRNFISWWAEGLLVLFTNTARFQTSAQGTYNPPYLVRAGGHSREPEWGLVLSRRL